MDNTRKFMLKVTLGCLAIVTGITVWIINVNDTYSIPSGVTVTFYGRGGKILKYNSSTGKYDEQAEPYTIENAETYTDPEDESKYPTQRIRVSNIIGQKEGKRFIGWSNGNNQDDVCDIGTNSIRKSNIPVNMPDINLYACYEYIPTATFTVYDDDTIIDTETGDRGTKETVYSEKYETYQTTTTIELELDEFNANRFVAQSSGYVFRGWKTSKAACEVGSVLFEGNVLGVFGGEFGNFDVTYKVDEGRNNFSPCFLEDNGKYKIDLDLNGGKIDGKTTYQVQLSSNMQEFDLSTLNVEKKTKDCTDGYEFLGFYGVGEYEQTNYTYLKTWDLYIGWLIVGGQEEGLTASWGSCKGNTSEWVEDTPKEDQKYNVTFDVGTGGKLLYNDQEQTKKTFNLSKVTFSEYTATKDNKKFIGWAYEDNKDTCDRSKLKTSSTLNLTKDTTFYACYQENGSSSGEDTKTYKVTFDTRSCGTLYHNDRETSTKTFNLSKVTFAEYTTSKDNKKFIGWAYEDNKDTCDESKLKTSSTLNLTKDTTFYACCTDKTNSNDGNNNDNNNNNNGNNNNNNNGSTNGKENEEIDKNQQTGNMLYVVYLVGILALGYTIYYIYKLNKVNNMS